MDGDVDTALMLWGQRLRSVLGATALGLFRKSLAAPPRP
jgi:hypothetical protein